MEFTSISARTPNQKKYIKTVIDKDVVFCTGPAGSGKTTIAVGLAVQHLAEGKVDKILFTRPCVEAGEHLGYLPGNAKQKLSPYLKPIFDELQNFLQRETIHNLQSSGIIEIIPLAHMRGLNLHNTFVVGDEMQNATYEQIKLLLTRFGNESKMILTGDLAQSDLPPHKSRGYATIIEKLLVCNDIGIAPLSDNDIQRNPIVSRILKFL